MGETPSSATAALAAKRAALAARRQSLAGPAAGRRRRLRVTMAAGIALCLLLAGVDLVTDGGGWSLYPIAGWVSGLAWLFLRMRRNN